MSATTKKKIRQDSVGYLMIAPYYLFLLVFLLLPIVINVILSFTRYDMSTIGFIGLGNYRKMLSDSILHTSVMNTLAFSVGTLSMTIVLGLFAAMAFIKVKKGNRFFRTCFFMPYVVSMATASMIWLWLYDPGYGFLNGVLDLAGIPRSKWTYNVDLALLCVMFVTVWKFVGYNMVIFTSGLLAIPEQLYEAARIEGASSAQQLFGITLPMLKPTTFLLLVTGFINNFNVFEQVNILTGGGPMNSTTTIMHQVYVRAFVEYRMGYASAITILLIAIVAIVTALNFRFGSRGQDLDLS
jgi:multiple sugar transport system permease protein/raffinose/stachyose/melibiose transport system permease protein